MGRMIGIDLGTTNSCVAVMEGSEATVIPNSEGRRTTPSVVAFTDKGRLVGDAAKRQAVTNPNRTVSSIKRDMGSSRRIDIDGKHYMPQEISAMILQKLKADAESYLGDTVTDAVITVPAYFTDAQRQATKDAGRIAGLNVQRIINEPTSAALSYGMDKENVPQKVMVYDLGGGTFDVSILDIGGGVIEVLSTAGNNRLGGDDFDRCVADWLLTEFKAENRMDISKDPVAMQRVTEAAEKAKIELSGVQSTTINLPFIAQKKDTPLHLERELTRAKFDSLTERLVRATEGPVMQAMRDAGVTAASISKVLMVGGSSRIPAVQALVKRLTGKEPFRGVNPDECVAMGACLQGGVLSGTVNSLLLLDVAPLSLGIETVGGVFTKIIDRNTSIPITKSQVFTTTAPYQSSVEVHILQGESPRAADNRELGRFMLSGIRRAMAGVPQIEVTFKIDTDGIVNVSARDMDTGRAQQITVTGSSNMTQAEIDRAMKDAELYARASSRAVSDSEVKNRAESLLNRAKRLPHTLERDKRGEIQLAADRLRDAIKTKNNAMITLECDSLEALLGEASL